MSAGPAVRTPTPIGPCWRRSRSDNSASGVHSTSSVPTRTAMACSTGRKTGRLHPTSGKRWGPNTCSTRATPRIRRIPGSASHRAWCGCGWSVWREFSPYLHVDGRTTDFVLHNPGPAVVSSNGGKEAIVWVLDENAQRNAVLSGPKGPSPVLYALGPKTSKVLWKTDPETLQTSGKYNSPTITGGTGHVGMDRIVAFGMK